MLCLTCLNLNVLHVKKIFSDHFLKTFIPLAYRNKLRKVLYYFFAIAKPINFLTMYILSVWPKRQVSFSLPETVFLSVIVVALHSAVDCNDRLSHDIVETSNLYW